MKEEIVLNEILNKIEYCLDVFERDQKIIFVYLI
jgi:hypothetical protein